MRTNVQPARVKINVQIPAETRQRLNEAAVLDGKKVSALVRESIEEKIVQIEERVFNDKMKAAYKGLAEENRQISEDFRYSDAENISGDDIR